MQQLRLTLSTILILGLLSAITPLAIDTYIPSIPTIAESIETKIELVQLTVSVYLLTFAAFQLLFGPMSDAFGRRKIVFLGLSFYAGGSVLCALANSFEFLMIGRIIQAFGGAAVAVCVPALVRDSLSNEQFSKAMSYIFLVMAIAPLVAPIVGGVILVVFDWHYIFLFLALMALIAMVLFGKNISETLPMDKRASFSFIDVIKNYKQLLANRRVMGHIISGAFHFGGLMCFVTGSAFVYIEFYDVSELYFGFLFGLSVVGMMCMTAINSQLVERLGSKKMIHIGLSIVVFAAVLLVGISFLERPPLWMLALITTLFTAPVGTLGSNLMVGALAHAGNNSGSVVALAGTSRFMTGALSGVAVSILHNDTFVPMISIMAVTGFLSFLCYTFIAKKQ